jgi:hypothetical protein
MEQENARRREADCYALGVSYSPADQIGSPVIKSTSVHCQHHCRRNADCHQFSYSNTSKTCAIYSASSKVPGEFTIGGPRNCSSHLPAHLAGCGEGPCLVQEVEGNHTEGNLYINGKPVCDDDWGEEEAEVACRQLGFPGGARTFTSSSHYGQVATNFTAGSIGCNGEEESLEACSTTNRLSCDSGEAAGVACDVRDADVVSRERACFTRGMAYQRSAPSGPEGHGVELGSGLSEDLVPEVATESPAECQEMCRSSLGYVRFTWFFGGKCEFITDTGE